MQPNTHSTDTLGTDSDMVPFLGHPLSDQELRAISRTPDAAPHSLFGAQQMTQEEVNMILGAGLPHSLIH